MSQAVLFAFGAVVSFIVFGGLFVYGIATLKRLDRNEIDPNRSS
jgi:hypothetical protein